MKYWYILDMGEPRKYTKQKKSVPKDQVLYDYIYMKIQNR